MTGMRIGVVVSVLVPSALLLSGCGSDGASSTTGPDASADGSAGETNAMVEDVTAAVDAGPGDVPQKESGVSPDSEPQDVARLDAGIDASFDVGIDGASQPGIDAALDAGIDVALDAGIDAAVDVEAAIDASDVASDLQVVLRTSFAWANCMPMISEDPILVIWTVDITGARGDTAQLTKATIVVSSDSASIAQEFTVANPTLPLAGGTGSADQRKPIAVVSPNSACSSMCGGATYQLDLVYEIDGRSIAVNESGDFMCAY